MSRNGGRTGLISGVMEGNRVAVTAVAEARRLARTMRRSRDEGLARITRRTRGGEQRGMSTPNKRGRCQRLHQVWLQTTWTWTVRDWAAGSRRLLLVVHKFVVDQFIYTCILWDKHAATSASNPPRATAGLRARIVTAGVVRDFACADSSEMHNDRWSRHQRASSRHEAVQACWRSTETAGRERKGQM